MMNEFADFNNQAVDASSSPLYCQAWEECANLYYHHHHHHQHNHDHHDEYYSDPAQQHQQQQHDTIRNLFTEKREGDSRGFADDATWILTSSFVIFTMQSGFGMLEAGSCSPGFEVNIMMKNIVDVVFTALTYYLVGYGISFGQPSTPFMGKGSFPADGGYGDVESGLLYSQYIFQLSFAATSTTIVSGCVAMRLRFFVYVLYSAVAVIFYSFVAHWVFDEGGWLNRMGAHDFAGGAPVHVFGGINGLVATLFLGPRLGRFDGTRPISDFFPSSVSSQCLGMLALWWGWIGFNCGSSFGITDDRWVVAIRCAVTTVNSTVGGGVMSIIYTLCRTNGRLVIPEHLINGILGSLVAITPACASVHTYDAFPIGIIGALVGLGINTLLCHLGVDDPVGAIGVHAGSGMWGLISVGLFADSQLIGIDVMDGLFRGGGFHQLGLQVLTIVVATGWALMWSTSFFYLVGISLSRDWRDPRKGLRVDHDEEVRGADWHLHGVIDQEAYMADLEKENDLTGEEEKSVSSDASSSDDVFGEHETVGRKQDLHNKSDMYMRTLFQGQKQQHELPAAVLDDDDFEDNGHIFYDAEQEEDGKMNYGNNDETIARIEEGGEEMSLDDASRKPKKGGYAYKRTLAQNLRDEAGKLDISNHSRRDSAIMDIRTRTANRGLGLNGGLGQAIISNSARFEMSPDEIRRARRTPRNVGVSGQSMMSDHSHVSEVATQQVSMRAMKGTHRAQGGAAMFRQPIASQRSSVANERDEPQARTRRATMHTHRRASAERSLHIYR